MDWLALRRGSGQARRQAERSDIRTYYPPVKTVVVLAMNYFTGTPSATQLPSPEATSSGQAATATARLAVAATPRPATSSPRWSNYAWGDDYHRLIKKRLKALLTDLAAAFPEVAGIACVDTSPVMEKAWAQRAGLGWQGKHTNLITRDYGSWVFLAELLLDVALEPDQPFEEDLCGSCTACLEVCPTGALDQPYQLDARRCISYLTIEHRGPFTAEQAGWVGDWLYGCDLCQEVCPWNIKFAQLSPETAFQPREFISSFDLQRWRQVDAGEWDRLLRGSAARRAGYEGLGRNIQAVTANGTESR